MLTTAAVEMHSEPTRAICPLDQLASILAENRPLLRARRRQRIYSAGQHCDHIYLILKGMVKTITTAPSGRSCLLDVYGPNELFGTSGLVSPVRPEAAIAITQTVACKVPKDAFLSVVSEAGILADCLLYFADRLAEREHQVTELTTLDSEHRLAFTLLRLSSKIGVRIGGMTLIGCPLTQQELAEMVGTTRSRIGYFLTRFRTRGLIGPKTTGHLLVAEHALREYLEGAALMG